MAFPVALPRIDRARVRRTVREMGRLLGRYLRPVRAPLRNLAATPLTAVGIACFDAGIFLWSVRVGLMVTGISLVVLEHVIADEE